MYSATPEGSPARCASSDEQITGLIPPPTTAPIAPMETPENLTRTSNMSAKKPPCGPYISGCTTPSATTIASVISAGSLIQQAEIRPYVHRADDQTKQVEGLAADTIRQR